MGQRFHNSTHDTLGRRWASSRFWRHLAVLCVAATLSIATLTFFTSAAPHARAAGGDAIVHWDSSMIYAGHNNGFPYGPVGEHAIIHGENFLGHAGQTVKLKLIPGDINNPPGGSSAADMCTNASTKVSIGSVGVDSSGKFDFNFDWPSAANHGQYSVCVYQPDGSTAANFDDGPFSVLSAGRPSIALNHTTVAAGSTLTVTGKNWVPPQKVHVLVGVCMYCDAPPIANKDVTSGGLNSGTFSVTFTIPAGTAPGDYSVGAFTDNSVLDVGPSGVKKINVTPPATPTPVPTATAAATASTVGGVGGTGTNGTGTGLSGDTLLIALVIGLIGLLAIVLVVALVLLLRRRKPEQQPGTPAIPGGYPAGGYPPAGYSPQGYAQPGYPTPQPPYPQPEYPPQGYADPNAPTVGVGVPYVAPTPQTPQPDWGTPPQNQPPSQAQAYPMRDDSPTRPSSFPPDADTFPPS
jgi:hypothetical protein